MNFSKHLEELKENTSDYKINFVESVLAIENDLYNIAKNKIYNVYDIDAIPKIVERNVEQTSKTTNVITEETTTVENTTEDFTTKEQISKATDDNPKLPQTGLKTMNVVLIGCFGIALTLLGVRILKNEE